MMRAERDYGVRIIRPYDNFSVGQVVFPFAADRARLIKNGFAEKVEPHHLPRGRNLSGLGTK